MGLAEFVHNCRKLYERNAGAAGAPAKAGVQAEAEKFAELCLDPSIRWDDGPLPVGRVLCFQLPAASEEGEAERPQNQIDAEQQQSAEQDRRIGMADEAVAEAGDDVEE